ncbi:MAG TPA: tRNA epoxyqueuosine(34) reductase QueG [Stellaceae bacterium]|nr:tRNA epoxyqueuosine(34) reductase QueG [Stellaceae bacterium]
MDAAELKRRLIDKAAELGFDTVRVTDAAARPQDARNLADFLAAGSQGDMDWLARDPERRSSPQGLWPDVRSVVVLGTNYGPATSPLDDIEDKGRAVISAYARGKDYHDVVKKRLKALGRWFHDLSGVELKIFVDTAPVMEKPLGARAGLGWQGKHTNLVSRDFGSWLFLAELYTAVPLPADEAESDHCGACQRCIDICPTRAITAPYRLDPRRCISYLTIEHKGPIPLELRPGIGNRIYGCDDCLAVCPWNKFAQASAEMAFQPREGLAAPNLVDFIGFDDARFREFFAGSPIKRIGRVRFIRNVLIALGNSGMAEHALLILPLIEDEAPLVRGMAVWALCRLAPALLVERRHLLESEADDHVRLEWQRALSGRAEA